MAKYIGLLRIQRAIIGLQDWRSRVDSQGAMHLIHFLAAKASGVDNTKFTVHSEEDDKTFCEKTLRVRPGTNPYFDPLENDFRIETHHHSNVATARKKTFADRWKAASYKTQDGDELWKFADDYLQIVESKVLSKGGVKTRVPLYDVCAWIYRAEKFDDNVEIKDVRDKFIQDYNLTKDEMDTIFSSSSADGAPEVGNGFFVSERVPDELILSLVENVEKFDATEAAIQAAEKLGRSPVKTDDVAEMIKNGRRQIILQGPPGTGKTYLAKLVAHQLLDASDDVDFQDLFIDPNSVLTTEESERVKKKGGWSIVQLHPSYSYEDFVRGIFAKLTNGTPSFAVQNRVFTRLCELALTSSKDIVLIIDEVNRADLSKVLGELVYALEYRDERVSVQYVQDGNGTIVVPKNLVIIGTMNTADHSIAHIDYAIRRRFDFVDVVPDRAVIAEAHKSNDTLRENTLIIYDAIAELLAGNREQAVGHSFFLGKDENAVAHSIVFQVLPLLADYRKEGIIEESESLALKGWPGKGVPLYTERPFELVKGLVDWLGQDNAKPSAASGQPAQ